MTCADVSGPESLLRGPDRKKLDRLAANQSAAHFPRIPDRKEKKSHSFYLWLLQRCQIGINHT